MRRGESSGEAADAEHFYYYHYYDEPVTTVNSRSGRCRKAQEGSKQRISVRRWVLHEQS